MKKKKVTYLDAGVDIDKGEAFVNLIKGKLATTFPFLSTGKVITELGGFSALVELPDGRIVALTTDGVGTKLMIAMLLDKHNTVGVDLVAMCVNDLIVGGVMPGVFIDYMALGKLSVGRADALIDGMVEGCRQAQCALIGGETAECPGLYGPEEYDLAGFAIGFADSRQKLILGDDIRPGMYVYGLPSSGLHSNAFSLVRKVFGINLDTPVASIQALNQTLPELGNGITLGEELLRPTRIYVQEVARLMKRYTISGMVNVTGGGLEKNPPRIMPENCSMEIFLDTWKPQPIFSLIQKLGNVSQSEMLRATNYGIGFMVISPDEIVDGNVIKIGEIIELDGKTVFFKNKK